MPVCMGKPPVTLVDITIPAAHLFSRALCCTYCANPAPSLLQSFMLKTGAAGEKLNLYAAVNLCSEIW